ncbi:MAG: hypothetical protein IKK33_00850 [Lachnospiraceae bacterium]|nr:hypothetical protein [Lachnospiraceae bacterium]
MARGERVYALVPWNRDYAGLRLGMKVRLREWLDARESLRAETHPKTGK